MFVSSYNTYINTNSSAKSVKSDVQSKEDNSKGFSSKLTESLASKSALNINSNANYISQTKVQYNKQLFDSQQQELQSSVDKEFKQTTDVSNKFSAVATLAKAKTAYSENSVMFSFLRKPQVALSQTPKIDSEMPQELQELKEQKIRDTMVNTYIQNDKYYQITA